MGKAQAAMEFLITYGWAILIVLAAIACLSYFGIYNTAGLLPTRCEFPAGLKCVEYPEAEDGTTDTISFPIVNTYGFDVTLDSATSTGDGNCNQPADFTVGGVTQASILLQNAEPAIVTMKGCSGLQANQRYKDTVTIMYTSIKTTMQHSTVGLVAGKAK